MTMERYISLLLAASFVILGTPRHVEAQVRLAEERPSEHAPQPMEGSLVQAGKITLGNGWVQRYSVYRDNATGDVWGDGYVTDPESIDATGSAGRWLSYTHYNGEFTVLGSDDGKPLRASFGPEDVAWSWTEDIGWVADIAHPSTGPQPLWPVVALVVAVAVVLSGDSGCSCGHNGGTENHPGSNHPEE